MGNETKMAASAVATAAKVGAHLTRNHFKRKIITAGVSVFATLAVSASGFAAWVLSSSAEEQAPGNVTVGVVEEAEITIEDLKFENDIKDFIFEPKSDDATGRVRGSGNEDDPGESLTITFSCKVGNADAAANVSVKFVEPKAITAAVSAGYLVSPVSGESTLDEQGNKVTTVVLKANGKVTASASLPSGWTYVEEDGVGAFKCTLSYAWGAKFGAKNPGVYYDDDEEGKKIAYTDVVTALHTFKATCHGMTYDAYKTWYDGAVADGKISAEELATLAAPQYKILISASA